MGKFISFLIFLFCFVGSAQAQERKDLKFAVLDINKGLSFNTVTSIVKDQDGFMWFGTKDGLNKYDGYHFKVYRNDPEDPKSISKSDILSLFEDSKGNLWAGTNGGGLCKYSKETDSFTTYLASPTDTSKLSNNAVTSIYEDKQGNLWIGTYHGLNLFDYKTGTFKRFVVSKDEASLSSNSIASIIEDDLGNLWVATNDNGLNLFDRESFTSKRFFHEKDNSASLSSNALNVLFVDQKNNLWIGTRDNGLDLLKPGEKHFRHFQHVLDGYNTISGNDIRSIEEDENGNLWIGTESRGINYFFLKDERFIYYSPEEGNPPGISKFSILDIFKDDLGIIWFGTSAGGVRLIDKNKPAFNHFLPPFPTKVINDIVEDKEGNIWVSYSGKGFFRFDRHKHEIELLKAEDRKNGLNNNGIVTMLCDEKGQLWLGTYGGGINIYDPKTKEYKHYLKGEKDNNLSSDKIYAIHEDKNGKIWIGTLGGGLNVLDLQTGLIKKYWQNDNDPKALSNNYVSTIVETKSGEILIGTYGGGINIYDEKNDSFSSYRSSNSNLNNDIITELFIDNKERVWLGTLGGGLNLFDIKNKAFSSFGAKNGLANEVINAIEEDQHGSLWLSTNKGISKFSFEGKTFKNFDFQDGLQSKEYRVGASFKSKNGEMFFGGLNGFDFFFPESIHENTNIPTVVLIDFQIFNKPLKIGVHESPLKKSIGQTEEIVLSYLHSVFTIEYTGLSYTAAEKNQYAYKLEGFDEDWNYVGSQRKATYTNLNPGDYVFRVKASNNNGTWNDQEKSLKITITPPFWKTWWFLALIAILAVLVLYQIIIFRTKSIIRKKRELENEVKKRTQELHESNLTLLSQKEEMETQAEHLNEAYEAIKNQGEKLEVLYSDIKDSIRAAKEIQQSILPPQSLIKKYLPESFICYKPKDVVSGDIYWFDVKDDKIIIAAVDCTGHGVSGAFMSINAHHLINQSIGSGELVASEILGRLNEGMLKEINQQDLNSKLYDGMDISLCILNLQTLTLEFSGANLPLYILRENEIIQLKGTRRAIGLQLHESTATFENHQIKLIKDDIIYLFSDGYADQIGGADSYEKFMYPRFREFLVSIRNKTMENQLVDLENTFNTWKGENDQLDDVLVIGIKV